MSFHQVNIICLIYLLSSQRFVRLLLLFSERKHTYARQMKINMHHATNIAACIDLLLISKLFVYALKIGQALKNVNLKSTDISVHIYPLTSAEDSWNNSTNHKVLAFPRWYWVCIYVTFFNVSGYYKHMRNVLYEGYSQSKENSDWKKMYCKGCSEETYVKIHETRIKHS